MKAEQELEDFLLDHAKNDLQEQEDKAKQLASELAAALLLLVRNEIAINFPDGLEDASDFEILLFVDLISSKIDEMFIEFQNNFLKFLQETAIEDALYAENAFRSVLGLPPLEEPSNLDEINNSLLSLDIFGKSWSDGINDQKNALLGMLAPLLSSASDDISLEDMLRDGLFDRFASRSSAFAATTLLDVAGEAYLLGMAAYTEYLSGYLVSAILDRRTTPFCRDIDGSVLNKNLQTISGDYRASGGPPYHFYCRTRLLPKLIPFSELSEEASGRLSKRTAKKFK